jgi:hypothetical protein
VYYSLRVLETWVWDGDPAPTFQLADALQSSSGREVVLTLRGYLPPSLRCDVRP